MTDESKTWVEAIIDPKTYPNMPGSTIRLWGFDFKIYPGKHLCLNMPNGFVKAEVNANRVRIMHDPPPGVPRELEVKTPKQKEVEIVVGADEEFTMDIGTFYGAGNLDNLIEKLKDLKNIAKVKAFARKRFDVSFPNNAKMADVLEHVKVLVECEMSKE